jgi:hypothetical protein
MPIKHGDLNRRNFFKMVIATVVGILMTNGLRDFHHDYNSKTLKKTLEALTPQFKNSLVSDENNLHKNIYKLLEVLTDKKIDPANNFLQKAKQIIDKKGYRFTIANELESVFDIDSDKKIIFLNPNFILSKEKSPDANLLTVLQVLFSSCALISLNKDFLNQEDYLVNQYFSELISINIERGFERYNFQEVQCSSANELGDGLFSILSKLIKSPHVFSKHHDELRKKIRERMESLGLNERSNGTLNTY